LFEKMLQKYQKILKHQRLLQLIFVGLSLKKLKEEKKS